MKIGNNNYRYYGWEIQKFGNNWDFKKNDSWYWTHTAKSLKEAKMAIRSLSDEK